MKTDRATFCGIALSAALVSIGASAASAAFTVPIGQSTLIESIDYSDDFTVTGAPGSLLGVNNRRPDGYAGSNLFGSYDLDSHSNAPQAFDFWPMTFYTPANSVSYNKRPVTNSPGNLTGVAQVSGDSGNEWSLIRYDLRTKFTVQVDARTAGGIIFALLPPDTGSANDNALTVGISSSNITIGGDGASFGTGFSLPYSPGFDWANYAVGFDTIENTVTIYYNQGLIGTVNLNTFHDGQFGSYDPTGIAIEGYNADDALNVFIDNFQVGGATGGPAAIPEPGAVTAAAIAVVSLAKRRKRPIAGDAARST